MFPLPQSELLGALVALVADYEAGNERLLELCCLFKFRQFVLIKNLEYKLLFSRPLSLLALREKICVLHKDSSFQYDCMYCC
jgi:hypothetical protein